MDYHVMTIPVIWRRARELARDYQTFHCIRDPGGYGYYAWADKLTGACGDGPTPDAAVADARVSLMEWMYFWLLDGCSREWSLPWP